VDWDPKRDLRSAHAKRLVANFERELTHKTSRRAKSDVVSLSSVSDNDDEDIDGDDLGSTYAARPFVPTMTGRKSRMAISARLVLQGATSFS
jgi:hypothetical protein